MGIEAVQRRLSAILAADVVGYARLVRADEEGAVARLKALRKELVEPPIAAHSGRVVKLMGDGLLVEFPSVVDAMRAAVEVQTAMAERNLALPDEERVTFRVGINLGDVIIDGEDIQGDGVNVAARLEGIAEPGGICVSGAVHDQVQDRVDAVFEDLGEKSLKNIDRPLRVWRWRPGTSEKTGPSNSIAAGEIRELPDKPSIAVLPFDNMSGDPEQEFFADGMTEDIITALSRMPWFFVIARNSTFTYKGRAVDIKQVAQELGVQYVLEGSVRKAGNRLRITGQLIDALTGKHVWADRYDREITDIFEIQDEVTGAIVGAVAPEFLAEEAKRARKKDTAQLDAWECVMRGRPLLWKMSRAEVAEARRLFERALELAPGGEYGASDLALAHFMEAYYRWSPSSEHSMAEMMRAAERAVRNDDDNPWALTLLSMANTIARRGDDAKAAVEQAIGLSPSFAPAHGARSFVFALHGEIEEAIEEARNAVRLSPRDGFMAFWLMGYFWAYYVSGRLEEAVDVARQGIRLAPANPTYRRQLAAALAKLGRLDEARAAIAEYRRLEPDHTLADAAKVPTMVPEHLEMFLDGLRLAGLGE